jgi:2-amino-4-hydroxy-6-hydroxymethyldihydropteridine diphosphokinase
MAIAQHSAEETFLIFDLRFAIGAYRVQCVSTLCDLGDRVRSKSQIKNQQSKIKMRSYIGLGSNLGDRAANLAAALRATNNAGLEVVRTSSIYESEPVGVPDQQPLYLNMVAELRGNPLPPPEILLETLQAIEQSLGRRRDRPLAARTIDLDLLIYGDLQLDEEALTIPHPRMHLRRFVLAPLAEIAPDEIHPVTGMTFGTLLAKCYDPHQVRIWKPTA